MTHIGTLFLKFYTGSWGLTRSDKYRDRHQIQKFRPDNPIKQRHCLFCTKWIYEAISVLFSFWSKSPRADNAIKSYNTNVLTELLHPPKHRTSVYKRIDYIATWPFLPVTITSNRLKIKQNATIIIIFYHNFRSLCFYLKRYKLKS